MCGLDEGIEVLVIFLTGTRIEGLAKYVEWQT